MGTLMRNVHVLCCLAVVIFAVTCSGQTKPATTTNTPPSSDVLADSEIQYTASGGIAGRTQQAILRAENSRVEARYRPGDVRGSDAAQAGVVEPNAYLLLWRDLDRLNLWTIESAPRSRGADLIEHELRIRRGTRTHVIRWDDGLAPAGRLKDAAAFAQKVEGIAREYAAFR